VGTTRCAAESADQGVGERTNPLLEGDHRGEDRLLVVHDEHIGLEHPLDRGGDLRGRQAMGAIEDPNCLHHRHQADEAGIGNRQPLLDQGGCRR